MFVAQQCHRSTQLFCSFDDPLTLSSCQRLVAFSSPAPGFTQPWPAASLPACSCSCCLLPVACLPACLLVGWLACLLTCLSALNLNPKPSTPNSALQVSRLEDFVEAQLELIPDWQKALEVVQVVKR